MSKLQGRARRTREFRAAEREQHSTIDAPLPSPTREVKIKGPAHGLRIAVIPDTQVKPDVPLDHLRAAGLYIAAKQPDVVVCIGDFADMPSLSTHDAPGSAATEGKNYKADVDAVLRGMDVLMEPIHAAKGYEPRLILTLGNHEDRITRAVSADPRKLRDVYSLDHLGYAAHGWEVVPFLQPVTIGGVAFCHYFPSGIMGRPIMRPSLILSKLHMSAYAGHQQGREIAYAKRADGRDLTAIISGSFYQHDESYLSPFTNRHWRGMYFLHEVRDGSFDEMAVSINFLKRKFG
jgi:hypothetical protein